MLRPTGCVYVLSPCVWVNVTLMRLWRDSSWDRDASVSSKTCLTFFIVTESCVSGAMATLSYSRGRFARMKLMMMWLGSLLPVFSMANAACSTARIWFCIAVPFFSSARSNDLMAGTSADIDERMYVSCSIVEHSCAELARWRILSTESST